MITSNVYQAGFLKTLPPLLPSSGSSVFRLETIFKVANIKTKSATIAFFSYPPFFLLANAVLFCLVFFFVYFFFFFFFISLGSVVFGRIRRLLVPD